MTAATLTALAPTFTRVAAGYLQDNAIDADDVAQDMLIMVWQRGDTAMTKDGPLLKQEPAYIARWAVRRVAALNRARYRRKLAQIEPLDDSHPSDSVDHDLLIDLSIALGKLRAEWREIAHALIEGYSERELIRAGYSRRQIGHVKAALLRAIN